MKRKILLNLAIIFTLVLPLSFSQSLLAQTAFNSFEGKVRENPELIENYVTYPSDVQKNILEAAKEPQLLVRAQDLQENSKANFQQLLAGYSQNEQSKIWNIVRYPELVKEITQGGKKSSKTLKKIAKRYPSSVQKDILDTGRKHYNTLVKIDALYRETSRQANGIMINYPNSTQRAFRELLTYPEVISAMNEDLNFTVLMGEAYQENPRAVSQIFREENIRITRRNNEALEDWRRELENDPEAMQELRQSANEFNQEAGYLESEIAPPQNTSTVLFSLSINAFPYWFGYPTWYSYGYWRPYPSWYHCGCYWGPGDSFFVFGLPSFYYTQWYFYQPRHYHRHRHLSNHYVNHYYRHRSANYGFHRAVHQWENVHQRSFDNHWYQYTRTEYRQNNTNYNRQQTYRKGDSPSIRQRSKENYTRQKPTSISNSRNQRIQREEKQIRTKTKTSSSPRYKETKPATNSTTYRKPGMKTNSSSSQSSKQGRSAETNSQYRESSSTTPNFQRSSGGESRSRSSFGGRSGGGSSRSMGSSRSGGRGR
ncbi:MAG: hypothetical protein H7A32_02935 [Deltaproteobacteria bacterium]|nr:hypothetical protein [Deltaproteobacteria bacterium]